VGWQLEIKTADHAANVAVDYVKKTLDVKGKVHVTSVAFNGTYFLVRGNYHFEGREGMRPQGVIVKIDGEGNVVGWSLRPETETTEIREDSQG
jgi:hypothetical protein